MPTMRKLTADEIHRLAGGSEAASDRPADPYGLDQAAIRAWVGDASFERGRSYARADAVFNLYRQGTTLKALCQGSLPQPYRVQATLGPGGVAAAQCSCPVGGDGRCKHVAALLLAWLDDPARFVEIEDLETALERRSKAELIALIRQMVARAPELETLIGLPAPGSTDQPPLDPELIRHQVRSVFTGDISEWGAAYGIAQDLEGLVQIGKKYTQAGDWRNAAIVYQSVAQELLKHYEELDDEGGEVAAVVNECVTGLGSSLSAARDPGQREVILRVLFDIYRWDVDFGGVGIGDEAPDIMLAQATPEERERIAAWVRAALPAGGSRIEDYRRQRYGGFLLALEGDKLDDEGFLHICRATGRTHDLVERLLVLGRLDEALAEIRRAPPGLFFTLADLLRTKGHADLAERLVREQTTIGQDYQGTAWLKERAIERGDLAEALALAEALLWRSPSLTGYADVQRLARQLGTWEHLRPQILARLAQEQQHALLTEIHLREGEIEQALQTLPQAAGSVWGGYGEAPLSIRVAQAAEEQYPRDAIRIYTTVAQRLIQQQGRENYATAARYLARVRDLYRRLGEETAWSDLIGAIRQQHKRLRALQEELSRAGL